MFDDLTPKNQDGQPVAQPAPGPAPVPVAEDMFSGTEPEKPAIFQPKKASNFQDAPAVPVSADGGHAIKRIIFLSLILVGLAMIAFGGYYAYENFYAKKGDDSASQAVVGDQVPADADKAAVAQEGLTVVENEAASSSASLDSDQDGLTDAEEDALGSNKTETDSDFDGLFDREEVKVYGTNPVNPDTDADGVKDGAEVDAKTNPKGEGALYSLDGSSSTSSPSSVIAPSTGSPDASTSSGELPAAAPGNNVMEGVPLQDMNVDSDSDGLTDAEETGKYGTNPKNKDTDGDGYLDGAEVEGGYDPKGPGKLK